MLFSHIFLSLRNESFLRGFLTKILYAVLVPFPFPILKVQFHNAKLQVRREILVHFFAFRDRNEFLEELTVSCSKTRMLIMRQIVIRPLLLYFLTHQQPILHNEVHRTSKDLLNSDFQNAHPKYSRLDR